MRIFTEEDSYQLFSEDSSELLLESADSDRNPDPLTRKLRTFQNLAPGWSHGEGQQVDPDAIRIAEEFVKIATLLQLRADVFPGLHGGCAVTFYYDDRSVEVIVDPTHPTVFGLHVEDGVGLQFTTVESKEDASHEEAVRHILQLVPDYSWMPFVSSVFGNLTAQSGDSQMWSSSTLQGHQTLTLQTRS